MEEVKKALEPTSATLTKLEKDKDDLKLEKDQALLSQKKAVERAETVEKRAEKAEADAADALKSERRNMRRIPRLLIKLVLLPWKHSRML